MAQPPTPEFSRPAMVEDLETGGEIRRKIEADESERAVLAARLDLLRLDSLSAEMLLRRQSRGAKICVEGRLTADVVQRCVATLAPVPDHIDESFEEIFAPVGYEPAEDEQGEDLPEYFDGHMIDIGELAAQLLSLSLNPYPRDTNAIPKMADDGSADMPERRRPFEGLAQMLKNRR